MPAIPPLWDVISRRSSGHWARSLISLSPRRPTSHSNECNFSNPHFLVMGSLPRNRRQFCAFVSIQPRAQVGRRSTLGIAPTRYRFTDKPVTRPTNGTMNKNQLKVAAGAALVGASIVAAAAPSFATTNVNESAVGRASRPADSGYDITSAAAFIAVNHSGSVILTAANGEQYTIGNCRAELTGSGAVFSGCTGEGSSDFFPGQPTNAVLSSVAQDGHPHDGQLVISNSDGSSTRIVLTTVNFPTTGGPANGCVFLPDSTTSAFSCQGGQAA